MILYLSAGTESEYFRKCQQKNYIKGGYQAQKFNQMVIEGLASQTNVTALSNLPFDSGVQKKILPKTINLNNVTYISLGNNPGKLHKVSNIIHMVRYGIKICKMNEVDVVVCDAVNPLASLTSNILHILYRIQTIAIVTDIPSIMSEGQESFFSRLSDFLLKRYQGYVLLTEAMNHFVNPTKKPYIVMEGLCDISEMGEIENIPKKPICVYTGSLFPNTGIENMISGFKKKKIMDYQLHIYGNGPLVENLCDGQGVIYCGAVTNQECVLRQKEAALLINPRPVNLNYAEYSFPSKIMEYMVSGTPVLSTMLPGIPAEYAPYLYWIEEDSGNGICEALERVLGLPESERETKGNSARRFVLEKKNNVYQAKRILNLIEKIKR